MGGQYNLLELIMVSAKTWIQMGLLLQAFIANWPYVKREVMLLSKLKHPHIVGFREVFLSDNDLALVMTFVPGGTLSDYLMSRPTKSLSEAKARLGLIFAFVPQKFRSSNNIHDPHKMTLLWL